jgi:N-acetylneuraminic acid mutarotase
VSVTPVVQQATIASKAVGDALQRRLAETRQRGALNQRLISIHPSSGDAKRFEAVIYDYTVEQGFRLVLDVQGNELGRQPLADQPGLSEGERSDAQALVSRAIPWARKIAAGTHEIYAPMPPITVDAAKRRLVNVGVFQLNRGSQTLLENEIVSVHIPTGSIVRYTTGAPPKSRVGILSCNPPPMDEDCNASSGSCDQAYLVQWPLPHPVWKFKIRHPLCTTTAQPQGTGLELTEVFYNNHLVLQRADMPVLNVQYDNDFCGPYRDWLSEEDCFQATGVDVSPGIRVTTGNATPYTFCEADPPSDVGNFKGIAIHDEGGSLLLLTEMTAGWYRYVMKWRLHLDGTIEPMFGFGAVTNFCTCHLHHHHAYWRFEWALDGVNDNPSTGISTLERRQPGTQDVWNAIPSEGRFIRPAVNPTDDWFRVRNPQTGMAYVLEPGMHDGVASTYAKGDLWGFALNPGEIDDPNPSDYLNTDIYIDAWLNGDALGASKRLVTWYRAGYDHNGSVDKEPCEIAGPRLILGERPPGWATLGSMGTCRRDFATAVAEGKVFVMGGTDQPGSVDLTSVEALDPASGWTTRSALPVGRRGCAAVSRNELLVDAGIYLFGGTKAGSLQPAVLKYNPGSDQWSTVSAMPNPRSYVAGAMGVNGKMYLFGGLGPGGTPTNTVEEYDPANGNWTSKAPMPTARYGMGAVGGADLRIYVIGDLGPNGATVESYDPESNTWESHSNVPTARSGAAVVAGIDGRIYVLGGFLGGGLTSNVVERYWPCLGRWETLADNPILTARGGLGAGAIYQTIYAVGGTLAGGAVTCATESFGDQDVVRGTCSCDGSGTQVLYYTFDDPSNRYHDDSGRGHTGAIAPVGGASMVPGVVAAGGGVWGKSLNFTIAPGNTGVEEYSTADAADLDIAGAMTAIAWIRPHGPHDIDPGDCVEGTIFSKGGANWFQVNNDNGGLLLQNYYGTGARVSFPAGPLAANTWHQVAFRRSGVPGSITMYLDGVPFGAAFLSDAVPDNAATLSIGNFGFHGPWECEFNGEIDELQIFNGCKSSAFISSEYHRIRDALALTVSIVGNGAVSRTPQHTLYTPGTPVSLSASPATDSYFSGWSGEASGTTNPLSITMNANKAITAEFLLMAYDPGSVGKACGRAEPLRMAEGGEGDAIPYMFALSGNNPNPFADGTVFRFTLPRTAVVAARVFDLNGRLVAELSAGPLGGGQHELAWNGRDLSGARVGAGVYLFRLEAGTESATRRVVVVR